MFALNSVQIVVVHKYGVLIMENMYSRIIALCESKGVKPGKMCSETGLSRGMITDLKMGRTKELSAKNSKIIADYFGVSVDYLLSGDKKEQKNSAASKIADGTDDDISEYSARIRRLSPEKRREFLRYLRFLEESPDKD